ncbi:ATP-binding protein [Kitasatospora sp. NPDC094019]|uniref:ATP-binding protein n=1 Tax=Kitasatospora sp. NPDC094019 TaxID=3364091 RepID=UPI003823BB18
MNTAIESPSITRKNPGRKNPRPPTDSTCLSFPNDAACVAAIRSATSAFLRRTHPHHRTLLADALLVVTELATNVVQHTDGPGRLTLTAHRHGLDIDVSDTSRALPSPAPLTPEDLHGRGLALVAALTDSLTLTLDPGSGKTVHAHLPDPSTTPSAPDPDAGPRAHRTW